MRSSSVRFEVEAKASGLMYGERLLSARKGRERECRRAVGERAAMRRTAEPCGHIALLAPEMSGRTGSLTPAGDEDLCRGARSPGTAAGALGVRRAVPAEDDLLQNSRHRFHRHLGRKT